MGKKSIYGSFFTEGYKYLRSVLNKDEDNKKEIKELSNKREKRIRMLNSTLGRKYHIKTKKRIYSSFVESISMYGTKVWDIKKTNRSKLLSTEIDARETRYKEFSSLKIIPIGMSFKAPLNISCNIFRTSTM